MMRKAVKDKIDSLTATEHEEVLRILTKHGVGCSRNSNGMFINLTAVPDAVVEEVHEFVQFCIDNTQSLDEYDQRLVQCKMGSDISILSHHHHRPQQEPGGEASGAAATTAAAAAELTQEEWRTMLARDRRLADLVTCIAQDKTRVLGEAGGRAVGHRFNIAKKRYCQPTPAGALQLDAAALLEREPYAPTV